MDRVHVSEHQPRITTLGTHLFTRGSAHSSRQKSEYHMTNKAPPTQIAACILLEMFSTNSLREEEDCALCAPPRTLDSLGPLSDVGTRVYRWRLPDILHSH